MRSTSLLFLMIVAIVGGFIGYCYALLDWVQDFRSGLYLREHCEAFYETAALIGYHALGIRFLTKANINLF